MPLKLHQLFVTMSDYYTYRFMTTIIPVWSKTGQALLHIDVVISYTNTKTKQQYNLISNHAANASKIHF
ncbi:hypothetical protein PPBDW_II0572 [Photobacterium kishitanii]|nr:hypothetical protein PPBDW_II0572 [Photobacterium kishitanii]